ncbi:MAG: PqqD family protein [Pirellulales bacterium]
MAFKIAAHLAWQRLQDEAVIIDIPARVAVGLNQAGLFIWERLEQNAENEITRMVADNFEIDLEQARRDVASFLEEMTSRGFIETGA